MPDSGGVGTSSLLREHGAETWDAAVHHPMVREIAAGSLPRERFRAYFEQNIAYLEEYARAIALIAAHAPDGDALAVVTALLDQIVSRELPANRRLFETLGGSSPAAKGVAMMRPTTYDYTRHLLAVAALEDCAAGLCAVLPCQWSYGEIGVAIGGSKPEDPIYAEWIAMFDNAAYSALVAATTQLLDRLAGGADEDRLAKLTAIFDASTRFELAFWDMAYRDVPVVA